MQSPTIQEPGAETPLSADYSRVTRRADEDSDGPSVPKPSVFAWRVNPLSAAHFVALRLIAVLSAFSVAYAFMRWFTQRTTFDIIGQSGWARTGASAFALTFASIAIFVGTKQKKTTKAILGYFRIEAGFLVLLGVVARTGLLTRTQSKFLISASLLYLPCLLLSAKVAAAIAGAAHLNRADARILVVGTGQRVEKTIERLRVANDDIKFVGCLNLEPCLPNTSVAGVRVVGSVASMPEFVFGHPVDLVVVAIPSECLASIEPMIDAALKVGIPVSFIDPLSMHRLGYETDEQKMQSAWNVESVPLLSTIRRDPAYLLVKRVCDVVISATLLTLLAPVFAVVGILIKLMSPRGPIFYQWRVLGHNRRPFLGYKFRTMVPNADQLKETLMRHNEMTGPVFKMRNDPRITPLGRILRKFSIDELPQLYSVLKGDMSLVGPRPPSKREADQFKFWQRRKLSVRPGITCLWQIGGRSEITDFDNWAALDLEYIDKASLSSDLAILLKTLPAVISGKGAH
jgi:exopolysaccharide biosynthesis polyprenyl glycosylphosphotransferase